MNKERVFLLISLVACKLSLLTIKVRDKMRKIFLISEYIRLPSFGLAHVQDIMGFMLLQNLSKTLLLSKTLAVVMATTCG